MAETFFCTCPRGLEQALAEELREIGIDDPRVTDGGVSFRTAFPMCYRVNLQSRIAGRVLWRLGRSRYRNEEDVYRAALDLPWSNCFHNDRTFLVKVVARRCALKSLEFITLRIKDAICDHFRAKGHDRPSVDTHQPDMRIHAFLDEETVTLYLDTSGDALFKRGLRQGAGEAPLRENLAAGILRLTGWKPGEALLDPMCGSGTFLMEAAQMVLNIAPGLDREFAFSKLRNFDAWHFGALRKEIAGKQKPARSCNVFGSDNSADACAVARENLLDAGLADCVQLEQRDILDVEAPASSGVLVTNPPYGVRIGEQEELEKLYPELGHLLKKRFSGWRAYFFTSDMQLAKLIRLSASKRTPLYNGPLECRLFEYRLVEGSNRKKDAP